MRHHAEFECPRHPDRFECSDAVVHYHDQSDSYGLIVHDGGRSIIRIAFCPWCATPLRDLSQDWLHAIQDQGLSGKEAEADLPEEFRSSAWWRARGF